MFIFGLTTFGFTFKVGAVTFKLGKFMFGITICGASAITLLCIFISGFRKMSFTSLTVIVFPKLIDLIVFSSLST